MLVFLSGFQDCLFVLLLCVLFPVCVFFGGLETWAFFVVYCRWQGWTTRGSGAFSRLRRRRGWMEMGRLDGEGARARTGVWEMAEGGRGMVQAAMWADGAGWWFDSFGGGGWATLPRVRDAYQTAWIVLLLAPLGVVWNSKRPLVVVRCRRRHGAELTVALFGLAMLLGGARPRIVGSWWQGCGIL